MARYPQFATSDLRKETFTRWNHFIDASLLAENGLFYFGCRDSVQCFYCGVILNSWKMTDCPKVEHLRYSPNCSFIKHKLQEINQFSTQLTLAVLQEIQDLKRRVSIIESDVITKRCQSGLDEVG